MRHSMFDFILDLKNIETINKCKTQDYYTIVQNNYLCGFDVRDIKTAVYRSPHGKLILNW